MFTCYAIRNRMIIMFDGNGMYGCICILIKTETQLLFNGGPIGWATRIFKITLTSF